MAVICSDNQKDKKFFEMLFNGIENKNGEDLGKCCIALQAFLNRPKTKLKKQIQAIGISTSTDFPMVTKDSFNVTIESQNFDMGWERAFREIPLGQNQDAWEIYNAANSLTFTKVQEGQRIDVAGYTGSKVTAYVDHYGGAIGWTDKMIRYRKVAAMLDLAETFRNKG